MVIPAATSAGLVPWLALRRAARGTLRRYERLVTDDGRAVPLWIAEACADLVSSGHLAETAGRPLSLTDSGAELLEQGRI